MTERAFWIEGEDRPSRWLITCDHATNRVPAWVGGGDLGIAPEDMARHIAYDVGAAGLASKLAVLMDAPAIFSDFSRLVIDPNRGEDDPTLLMRLYDGTVIPANKNADAAERERRLNRLHRPYHTALARLADGRPDRCICAIHSFTPQLRGRPRRPLRLASYCAMNASGGMDAMTSATASSTRSSTRLKRRHDLPMSSFRPAASNAARSPTSRSPSAWTQFR